MPFEVTKFADMYIANKTTIHSALGPGKVISVSFAQLSMGRRHSGILMIFNCCVWVTRANENWFYFLFIFTRTVTINYLLSKKKSKVRLCKIFRSWKFACFHVQYVGIDDYSLKAEQK